MDYKRLLGLVAQDYQKMKPFIANMIINVSAKGITSITAGSIGGSFSWSPCEYLTSDLVKRINRICDPSELYFSIRDTYRTAFEHLAIRLLWELYPPTKTKNPKYPINGPAQVSIKFSKEGVEITTNYKEIVGETTIYSELDLMSTTKIEPEIIEFLADDERVSQNLLIPCFYYKLRTYLPTNLTPNGLVNRPITEGDGSPSNLYNTKKNVCVSALVKYIGENRPVKAGEWYLIKGKAEDEAPLGLYAYHDMSDSYPIGELVFFQHVIRPVKFFKKMTY